MLSNIKLSSKNVIKPGKTLPLAKSFNASASHEPRQVSGPSSSDTSAFQGHVQTHRIFNSDTYAKACEARSCTGASNLSSMRGMHEERKSLNNNEHAATSYNSFPQAVNRVSHNHDVPFGEMQKSGHAYPDDFDDDNILEVTYFVFMQY